jgi:hypothetical protein
MSKEIKDHTRFVRWQAVLREHVTFVNNMLLVTGIGIIASLIALLDSKEFSPLGYQKFFFTGGLILAFKSVAIGIAMAASRLQDFRATVKKTKGGSSESKADTDFYGQRTWLLFYIQGILFLVSAIFLAIALSWIYNEKLF